MEATTKTVIRPVSTGSQCQPGREREPDSTDEEEEEEMKEEERGWARKASQWLLVVWSRWWPQIFSLSVRWCPPRGGVVLGWQLCACGCMCLFVAAAVLCAHKWCLNPETHHESSGDPSLPGILDVPCFVVNCEGRSSWRRCYYLVKEWQQRSLWFWDDIKGLTISVTWFLSNLERDCYIIQRPPHRTYLDGTNANVGGIIPVIIFKISFSIFYTLSTEIKGTNQRPPIRKCHRIIDFGENRCGC